MQRKIHNKTLFVAALSVYFGLLIVGAPPHILAQQIEAQAKQVESEVKLNRKPFDDFAKQLKEQISQGQVSLDKSCSVSVKAILEKDGKLKNGKIFNKVGDNALCNTAVSFLSAISDSHVLSYLSKLSAQPSNEVTLTFNANEGVFDLTSVLTLESTQRAHQVTSSLSFLFDVAKQRESNLVTQALLQGVKINSENENFIIVTRLPRAALDSLLKADEKAN